MRRREFIALVGGAAAIWPLTTRAQQRARPVIGYLSPGLSTLSANLVAAFRQGLKEAGYVENQNVTIEYRWAEGHYDRLPALVADLVTRQVAVIAALGGSFSGLAAKRATSTIPIVFTTTGDPVELGLVASLNRPGGNVTGVTMLAVELLPKRLELLHELTPSITDVFFLVNPNNPTTELQLRIVKVAADSLGVSLTVIKAATENDLSAAFASLVRPKPNPLLIASDTFFNNEHNNLAELSVRNAIPAIAEMHDFAVAGGLMSYGTSFADGYRQAGSYTGRILNGEKRANLAVQQSVKIELAINLKTARALGLTVPEALLLRADETLE